VVVELVLDVLDVVEVVLVVGRPIEVDGARRRYVS